MLNMTQKTIYRAAAMLMMSGVALTAPGVQAANLGGGDSMGSVYEYHVKYVDNHAKTPDKAASGAGGWAMATGVLLGAVAGKALVGSTLGGFAGAAAGGLATDKIATATENTKVPTSQLIVVEAPNGSSLAMTSSSEACDDNDAACLSVKGCQTNDRAMVMFAPQKPAQVIACYDHGGKLREYVEKHREQQKVAPVPVAAPQTTQESDHVFSGG